MSILSQIGISISLIMGVITGENISKNVFGLNNKWFLNLIDIFLFITFVTLLFNNTFIQSLNLIVLILLSFFFGLISSIASHAITTGIGYFSIKVSNKIKLKQIDEGVIIISLIRGLLIKGLIKKEIKELLINSGFNKKKVNYAIKSIKIEEEPREQKRTK